MSIKIGTQIGKYKILELIGRGGMAEVYKARHLDLESFVTIKLIRVERFPPEILSSVVKRFQNEARKMAQLSHPNIVKVIDFGSYEGIPFLVMDYMPGGTLKRYLGKPMPYRQAASLLMPVAEALAYAHSKGIIHRDVKPANILLSEDGRPMLSDFGVAKVVDSEETHGLTATGASIGTPEYMAPEQALGEKVDYRVDIYSMGVILFELITGRRPYSADTPMKVVVKQMQEPLPDPSKYIKNLPREVNNLLSTALAKNPGDRFADMNEFVEELSVISGTFSRQPAQKKPRQDHSKKDIVLKPKLAGKADWIVLALGVVGIFILAFALFRLLKGRGEEKTPIIEGAVAETAVLDQASQSSPTTEHVSTSLPPIEYTVQEGDSYASLAYIFDVSMDSIISMNNFDSDSSLIVGQTLLIPQPTPVISMDADSSDQDLDCPVVDYHLRDREYIDEIADLFSIPLEILLEYNGFTSETMYQAEDIRIPLCESTSPHVNYPSENLKWQGSDDASDNDLEYLDILYAVAEYIPPYDLVVYIYFQDIPASVQLGVSNKRAEEENHSLMENQWVVDIDIDGKPDTGLGGGTEFALEIANATDEKIYADLESFQDWHLHYVMMATSETSSRGIIDCDYQFDKSNDSLVLRGRVPWVNKDSLITIQTNNIDHGIDILKLDLIDPGSN